MTKACKRYTEQERSYLLRAARLRRSLTDKALAIRLGRSERAVSKILSKLRADIHA